MKFKIFEKAETETQAVPRRDDEAPKQKKCEGCGEMHHEPSLFQILLKFSEKMREKAERPKDKEPEVTLRLINNNDGTISLVAVDEHGYRLPQGNLLYITSRGKVFFNQFVNSDLGFPLEGVGELMVEGRR